MSRRSVDRPRGRRGLRHALPLVFAVLCASLGLPDDGFAHLELRTSNPADGDRLTIAPRELRLSFSEPVVLTVARVELWGSSGAITLAALRLDPDSTTVLIAPIPDELTAGTYTIHWQVASSDGHPVRGEYSFDIESGIQPNERDSIPLHSAPSFPSSSDFDAGDPLYTAVRWLNFLGLLGVVGVVAFRFAVLPVMVRRGGTLERSLLGPATRRGAELGLWMAALLAVATFLRLYAQSYALYGTEMTPELIGTLLARTVWGWAWLLQFGALALVFAGLITVRRAHATGRPLGPAGRMPVLAVSGASEEHGFGYPTENHDRATDMRDLRDQALAPVHFAAGRNGAWILAAIGTVALAFTPALSGHAVSNPDVAPAAILAHGLHVLGAGGWLGGLLLVVSVGIPVALRHAEGRSAAAVASLVSAFSSTALLFAAIVVLTGGFSAWLHLGSINALWESAYGQTLLFKLGLLSVVLGTGAYNWRRVLPALEEKTGTTLLKRSAALELAAGAAVLAVTAVLVATPPPDVRSPLASTEDNMEASAPLSTPSDSELAGRH